MLNQSGSNCDATDQTFRIGVAVAFHDDSIDSAEDGPWIFRVFESLADFCKNSFNVRRTFLNEGGVKIFHDYCGNTFSCFQKNIPCKSVRYEDVDFPMKDISAFDIS